MLKDTIHNQNVQKTGASYPAVAWQLRCSAELVAVGLLERLWHETMTNAPAGDIGKLDDEDIAEGVGWVGDATQLVTILCRLRMARRVQDPSVVVHKWDIYCPNTVRANNRKYGREFATVNPKTVDGSLLEWVVEPPHPNCGASYGVSYGASSIE